jgi:hypothetical protein
MKPEFSTLDKIEHLRAALDDLKECMRIYEALITLDDLRHKLTAEDQIMLLSIIGKARIGI